jgi:hypothetical protein
MRKLPDIRTPEQHMSDVTSSASRQLRRWSAELDGLRRQFDLLSDHIEDRNADQAHRLRAVAQAAALLAAADTRELLRDLGATLPVRGRDFGVPK